MRPVALLDSTTCWQITLAILQVGWLGIGIAGLAAAGNRLLRKASAACRYWTNFAAMLVLGLSLPAAFAVIRLTSAEPPHALVPAASAQSSETSVFSHSSDAGPVDNGVSPPPAHAKAMPGRPEVRQSDALAAPHPSGGRTSPEGFWNALRWLSPCITAVYTLGVAAMLVKLIAGIYGGQRLRAACRPVTDSRLLEIVARQAGKLGLRRIPVLSCCQRVAVPVVIGVIRPLIALPAAMIAGLSPEQLSTVLTHELAHLSRYDHLLILVQRLVEAVVFFHPAVWYLSRQVQLERENCCDDMVLAAGADRLEYADSLLRVAEIRLDGTACRGTLAGLAVDGQHPSRLRRRINRLLGIADEPAVRLTRSGLLTAALVLLLVGLLSVPLLSSPAETRTPAAADKTGKPAATVATNPANVGPLDVRLPWRVVDEETGKPLAGVAIAVRLRNTQPGGRRSFSVVPELLETYTLRTDAGGRCVLVLPGRVREFLETRFLLSLSLDGYAAREFFWDRHQFQPQETVMKQTTYPLLPGTPLSGRILNPDGSPAVHLLVKSHTNVIFPPPDGGESGNWTTGYTDRGGRFRLDVPKRGTTRLFLDPPKALYVDKTIGQIRGDIGDIRLKAGIVLRGRVLDEGGKPLPCVPVSVDASVNGANPGRVITDAQGRFELGLREPGDHWVRPVPDLEIRGQTPVEQLPERYRNLISAHDDVCVELPLPAAFRRTKISVRAGQPTPEIELKPVPHITLTARFVDREGKPAPAAPGWGVGGSLDHESWYGRFQIVPGRSDMTTAIVPRGLEDVSIENDSDWWGGPSSSMGTAAYWWWWTPKSARMPQGNIHLNEIREDHEEIVVERVESASLEIRVKTVSGKLPKDLYASVGFHGGDWLKAASPGVYRRSEGLLPDSDLDILVIAKGFKNISEGFKNISAGPFRFTECGQKGMVELTLVPGDNGDRYDRVPATLMTLDGRPIVKPPLVKVPEKGRTIECRAVDAVTGKPVAGASVKVEVSEDRDATGHELYHMLDTRITKTDGKGGFTVFAPQAELDDLDPVRRTSLRVTVSDPRYVNALGIAGLHEIAKKGVSASFPAFRLMKLDPAREIYGRVLDPVGRPVPGHDVYLYSPDGLPMFSDLPVTDKQGRFRTRVPAHAVLKLEVRTGEYGRHYHPVPADRTDLGELHLLRGVRVEGRVLDARGEPVAGIHVSTPCTPNTEDQPNFSYDTDENGRFETDALPPGKYLLTVGDFYSREGGLPIKLAPGVYVPLPLQVGENRPVDEIMLRPVEDVHCTVASGSNTQVPEKGPPPAAAGKGQTAEMEPLVLGSPESQKFMAMVFQQAPYFVIRGQYQGVAWEGSNIFKPVADLCVPKGLTDATIVFPYPVQRFQLDEKSPVLFGMGMHVAKIDHDLTGIKLYRYRDTTVKVHVDAGGAKAVGTVKRQVHYVRVQQMRDAGAVLPEGFPTSEDVEGDEVYHILPDEEIELSASALGMKPAVVRVQLKDGESRTVTMKPAI